MKSRTLIIGILVFILILIITNGFYPIDETKQVIITMFGKPVGEPVTEAGLHWKIPFFHKTHFFEKRILAWDGDPNQIPTKDKKYIWVDVTARWRISDPLLFLQSVGNETGAHARLDDIVDSETRDYVSNNVLLELVRNSNRPFGSIDVELYQDTTAIVEKIGKGRDEITRNILENAQKAVLQYGIELVDVRIKRINYVEEVREKVYERMISERRRIAERYRSEGKGQMAEIEGKREKELQSIRSEAYQTAKEIQGKADAEATRIYANAYNRDPEFYSFLKTLDTYQITVDSTTTLILTTKGDYLKFLTKAQK
jgi:membrane protease subunit HflC